MSVVRRLEFIRRDVSEAAVQATAIEPVDPLHRGVLDVLDGLVGTRMERVSLGDHFGLEQPDRALGQSVVVRVSDTADRRGNTLQHKGFRERNGSVLVVFTALAVARYLQAETGTSLRSLVRTLRPLQEINMTIAGHSHTATDPLDPDAIRILTALGLPPR